MQTFLPYSNFIKSAQSLDDKRLRCQIKEGMQIYKAITENVGWIHHPIVKMWKGYEKALIMYVVSCYYALKDRYPDVIHASGEKAEQIAKTFLTIEAEDEPIWNKSPDFHLSHQSNLVRKDKNYYSFDVPDDLPYLWYDMELNKWYHLEKKGSKNVRIYL